MDKLSGYYPARESINQLVAAIAQQVSVAMQQQNIAVRHNAFTDYCLALIFCSTGHRPIRDPIQSQKYFDIEQKWMLISDKVVHEERAWRIVALPEIACQQLEFYAEYLPRLTGWIAHLKDSHALVNELNSLITGEESIPYFFYLNESNPTQLVNITPSAMALRWESFWKLPVNFLRHVSATELLHSSGRADWVQIQLGHITGLEHPFGSTSTESVKSVLVKISRHIESFMKGLGWQAIRSPIRSTSSYLASASEPSRKANTVKELGLERRKKAREKRRELARFVVKKALNEVLGESRRLPSSDEFNEILQAIFDQAYEQRISINHCLQLFYRYIRMVKGGKALLRKVAHIRELEPEPSPFNESSVDDYKNTKLVRQRFLSYLDQNGRSDDKIDSELRVAEIIFSAALFGGLADPHKLNKLSSALVNGVYQYKGELFIDIPLTNDEKGPVFRWFPDSISLALTLGLYELKPKNSCSQRKVSSYLKTISNDLNLGKPKDILGFLAHTAKSGLIFDVPGHLVSCLAGDTTTVSLPLPQWIRLQSNLALDKASDIEAIHSLNHDIADSNWLPEHQISYKKTKPKPAESRKFIALLRSFFTQSYDLPNKKNISVSRQRKRHLVQILKKHFSSPKVVSEWSGVCLAIISWTVQLCEKGTRNKKNIAFSTVDNYVFLIARALTTLRLSSDFFSLDDSGYEELYLRAIEASPEHTRLNLIGRLIEFHSYLTDAFAVDEPAWGSMLSGTKIGEQVSYADANIISEVEYKNIIAAVQADKSLNARLKAQYIVLLIFGYRFGLRFGEALRIQYRDVQADNQAVCINVHNSIFGETKSAAGIRIVPLVEELNLLEREALQQLLSYSEIQFNADKQTPLMAEQEGSRELINRFSSARDLGVYLKTITGDHTLRFHHLRHSWASRMYAYAAQINSSEHYEHLPVSSINSFLWREFVGEHDCQYPLRSIATALGHNSETTTLEYYIHSVGETIQDPVCLDEYSVSTLAYAYALSIKHGTVRARLSRQKLFVLSKNIPQPDVKLIEPPKNFTLDNQISQEANSLNLVKTDLLLRRLSETQQSIDQLAYQLILDQKEARKALNIAAEMERESGFEFYRTDSLNKENLIHEEYVLPHVKFFKDENTRITGLLKSIESIISKLESEQIKTLKRGLGVWRITLHNPLNINLVSDQKELKALVEGVQMIIPSIKYFLDGREGTEEKPTTTSEDVKVRRIAVPLAQEKTENRKNNSISVYFDPGPDIKTQQSLRRLLFTIGVYLELGDAASIFHLQGVNKQLDGQPDP